MLEVFFHFQQVMLHSFYFKLLLEALCSYVSCSPKFVASVLIIFFKNKFHHTEKEGKELLALGTRCEFDVEKHF